MGSLSITLLTRDNKKGGIKRAFAGMLKRVKGKDQEKNDILRRRFNAVMFKDLRKRFDSSPATTSGGTVHGGVYWKELSDYTFFIKPERKLGQIHIDSGALRDSLTKPNSLLDSKITRDSYTFGSKLPYFNDLEVKYERPIVVYHRELVEQLGKIYMQFLISIDKEFILDRIIIWLKNIRKELKEKLAAD